MGSVIFGGKPPGRCLRDVLAADMVAERGGGVKRRWLVS